MRDSYFWKSLFLTLALYLAFLCSLMMFVAVAGLWGISIIFVVIILALIYFYGGFKRIIKFLDKFLN